MNSLSTLQLQQLIASADEKLAKFKQANLQLDITRGKPGSEQLSLSNDLLTAITIDDINAYHKQDIRNYGGLDGLDEMKAFFRQMVGVKQNADVIIGGNSSLTLMHNVLALYRQFGVLKERPSWQGQQAKFICPVPGYDRHFAICEHLGIEMIAVGMNENGPDMDAVEALVASDNSIKGMWCVPKYSNPTGVTYSDKVVERLAQMKTAADGFRIFWDNAYSVHHLNGEVALLKDMLQACAQAGHSDRVVMFASTSKITFAGAGVAAIITSQANAKYLLRHFAFQTIGPDKINQLRHVRFFEQHPLTEHMQRHAELLKPRFEVMLSALEAGLGQTGLATWTHPKGGYFISLDVFDGCAKEVVAQCAALGLKLTPAGSAFPYGRDEYDRNIRIAPSFPSVEQVKQAAEVLVAVIQKVCAEKKLTTA